MCAMMVVPETVNHLYKGEKSWRENSLLFIGLFLKEKADAYRILCDYALNGKMPDLSGASPVIATIFGFAKPVLDTAHKRAELAKKLSDQKQMEGGTMCVLHQQV